MLFPGASQGPSPSNLAPGYSNTLESGGSEALHIFLTSISYGSKVSQGEAMYISLIDFQWSSTETEFSIV